MKKQKQPEENNFNNDINAYQTPQFRANRHPQGPGAAKRIGKPLKCFMPLALAQHRKEKHKEKEKQNKTTSTFRKKGCETTPDSRAGGNDHYYAFHSQFHRQFHPSSWTYSLMAWASCWSCTASILRWPSSYTCIKNR